MIRIHTGGCPVCGSPIFVEFEKSSKPETQTYVFQGESILGEIGSVIHSCTCTYTKDDTVEVQE